MPSLSANTENESPLVRHGLLLEDDSFFLMALQMHDEHHQHRRSQRRLLISAQPSTRHILQRQPTKLRRAPLGDITTSSNEFASGE